jgi:hypothetical protein
MLYEIDVPDYDPSNGFDFYWEPGFALVAQCSEGGVRISGNREGLISLGRHLIALGMADVEKGYHVHLDDSNSLEDGSCEVILERI